MEQIQPLTKLQTSLENEYSSSGESNNDNDNVIYEQSEDSTEASSSLTESPLPSQIPTKKKNLIPVYKQKKLKESWVWEYTRHDKVTKEKFCLVEVDDGNGAIEQCNTKFQPTTSVTNIASHLRTVHRIYKNQKLNTPILTKTQTTITSLFGNHAEMIQPLSKEKQNRVTYRLLAWLVEAMVSLDSINHDRFRDFCYEINPRFGVPCTNTIKNNIAESTLYTRSNLNELINKTMKSVCITTDLWTQNHTPFIGITAHWLTEDFVMHQALLTIEKFEYPHTGDHIEDFLRRVLTDWNIIDKLVAVTTDNAASMIKAI